MEGGASPERKDEHGQTETAPSAVEAGKHRGEQCGNERGESAPRFVRQRPEPAGHGQPRDDDVSILPSAWTGEGEEALGRSAQQRERVPKTWTREEPGAGQFRGCASDRVRSAQGDQRGENQRRRNDERHGATPTVAWVRCFHAGTIIRIRLREGKEKQSWSWCGWLAVCFAGPACLSLVYANFPSHHVGHASFSRTHPRGVSAFGRR